jgi:hypothetical protein
MSDNTNLVRIGGWSGIVLILLFALAVFLLPGTTAGGWVSILGSLLIVPFYIGVYFILRDSGNEALIPMAFGLIGAVFLIQAYLVNAEFAYWYEERLAGASGVEQQILELNWAVRDDIVDELLFNVGSWLTMSLSLFLFALFGWRSKNVPRWIHIVGLITIVSGLGWLTPWPIPIEFGLRQLPSFLTLVIWSVGIGIVMVRYREGSEAVEKSQ